MEKLKDVLKDKESLSISKSLGMQELEGLTDYSQYRFTPYQIAVYLLEGIGVVALFSYVFYRSWIAFFIMLPFSAFSLVLKRRQLIEGRKEQLAFEFKEMMNSIIAGLQAGYSIENAFEHAYRDMVLLLGNDALIVHELSYMNKALSNNTNLETILSSFAIRSHVSDIKDFAQVFNIAKRSGGDLPAMLRNSSDIIGEKMDMKREITTIISSKKLEQSIMNVVPFGIILYIDMTSPGYFNCLYGSIAGVILMSVLLAIYVIAYLIANRITQITI